MRCWGGVGRGLWEEDLRASEKLEGGSLLEVKLR
jgi:hypothetical protein